MSEQTTQQGQSLSSAPGSGAQQPRAGSRKALKTAVVVVGLAIVATIAYGWLAGSAVKHDSEGVAVSTVKRGPLTIMITAGGSLNALEKLEIKSEVEGMNQILEIVPEGTIITEDDIVPEPEEGAEESAGDEDGSEEEEVKKSKILVKLDLAGYEEKAASREISYRNAESSLTQATEDYDIQLKQNQSDRSAAQLRVKFALMDLERYLGAELAPTVRQADDFDFGLLRSAAVADLEAYIGPELVREVIKEMAAAAVPTGEPPLAGTGPEEVVPSYPADDSSVQGTARPEGAASAYLAQSAAVEGSLGLQEDAGSEPTADVLEDKAYSADAAGALTLGGMAGQQLRKLGANVQERAARYRQAEDRLYWTQQLFAKEYASRNELERDEMDRDSEQNNLEAGKEELRLFVRYTLPKDSEEYFRDHEEAELNRIRVLARARSKEAQAKATLRSREATFRLEEERFRKTQEMIKKSTIRATKPGVIVYASTGAGHRRRGNPIEEGRNVRQGETIITMPDMSTLAAQIDIHETDIEKVQVGQLANITVEALTGRSFPGRLVRISPMASDQGWWNPDVKTYQADVALEVVPEGLSPGMTATVEIIVAELTNVLYVPIPVVNTHMGQRICWVKGPDGPELRQIETGYMTNKYVEITKGLRAGETVYLAPPEELPEEEAEDEPVGLEGPAGPAEQPQARPEAPGAQMDTVRPQPESGTETQGADADALRKQLDEARKQLEGLSPEERREKMRELMENLSPEQRQQLMQQFRRPGGGRRGPRDRTQGSPGSQEGASDASR